MNADTCPRCTTPVDDHTVAELREHLAEAYDHDLPFEAVPLQWQNLDVIPCGSVAVKAGVQQSAIGAYPVLIFEFTAPSGPLPPMALVLDTDHMHAVARLVRSAVDGAISAARKAS